VVQVVQAVVVETVLLAVQEVQVQQDKVTMVVLEQALAVLVALAVQAVELLE
jgi:hypothetical protein